jgi:AcrR family transcriptional regulator
VVIALTGPPTPESLQPNQRARRQRIINSALRRLVSSNYDTIKVSDVANDANVALGTVYRYFSSKEHLFAAAFYEWQESFGRRVQLVAPPEGDEGQRLRDFLGRTISAFQVQPQFYKLMLVLRMTSDPYAAEIYVSLDRRFRKIFDLALGDSAAYDPDRDAIFATVVSVLDQNLTRWVMGRESADGVYQAVDDAIRLIYRAAPER